MQRLPLQLLESDDLAVAIRNYKSDPSSMTRSRLVRVYQRIGMTKEVGKLVGPVMTKWSKTVSRFADEIQAALPSRSKRQGARPTRESAFYVWEAASELKEYGSALKWGDDELGYAVQEVHRAIKKAISSVRSPQGPKLSKKDKDRISNGLVEIEKEVKLLKA